MRVLALCVCCVFRQEAPEPAEQGTAARGPERRARPQPPDLLIVTGILTVTSRLMNSFQQRDSKCEHS